MPSRRLIFKWAKRIGIGSVILLILAIVIALAVQAYCTANAVRRYPPPGQLVDIGGYRLHLQDAGSGTPTVVLEDGAFGESLSWASIQPEVAKFTRVVSYDRAGCGWSDPSPADRTSKQIMNELNTLLRQARIPGPYVFVGASDGGFVVRLFAHEHPDQVAGMVLVDASHEAAYDQMPESQKKAGAELDRLVKVVRALAPLGIARWVIPSKGLPEELEAANRALALRTPNVVNLCDAWLCWDTCISQMAGCTLPPDIPLAVLSASKWDVGIDEIPPEDATVALRVWTECQAEIASQSGNSFHLVVPDSSHAILNNQPDVVVDAIRRVVESVRSQTKLVAPEL
ncbi:MAG: alpha/beta hydrolase [Sedimentisphaerales bacterium]|nr:alpha/beta hydrolase [Sedimentisphaerales bacterium]